MGGIYMQIRYYRDVQLRIGTIWAGEGIACHAERR